jgi:hypothetical protein
VRYPVAVTATRADGRTGRHKPELGPRQIHLAGETYDSGGCTVQHIVD